MSDMNETRESFLSGDLCRRYVERGLAIDQMLAWVSGQNGEDMHLPFCGYPNGGEITDCSCGLASAIEELERVGNDMGASEWSDRRGI